MPNMYYIFVIENPEINPETVYDTVIMGDNNAKSVYLDVVDCYKNADADVICHPVFFNDKGVQLVDYDRVISW